VVWRDSSQCSLLRPVYVMWTESFFMSIVGFNVMDRIILFARHDVWQMLRLIICFSLSDEASRLVSRTIVACQCIASRLPA
jgi:hypothetical protein